MVVWPMYVRLLEIWVFSDCSVSRKLDYIGLELIFGFVNTVFATVIYTFQITFLRMKLRASMLKESLDE